MAHTKTFSIPDSEFEVFQKTVTELAKRDLWTDSRIILEAVKEYGEKHLPGNPALPITNFLEGPHHEPFSPKVKEKWRLEGHQKIQLCESCGGSGKTSWGSPCSDCGGHGRVTVEHV
jgi:hypothetical protein